MKKLDKILPEDSKRTINVTVHNDFCYKITSLYPQNRFCRRVLTPLADEVCELRGFVVLPTAEDFAEVLRDELDEEDL